MWGREVPDLTQPVELHLSVLWNRCLKAPPPPVMTAPTAVEYVPPATDELSRVNIKVIARSCGEVDDHCAAGYAKIHVGRHG